jgi:hypothetical protein
MILCERIFADCVTFVNEKQLLGSIDPICYNEQQSPTQFDKPKEPQETIMPGARDLSQKYRSKLMTASQALSRIRSGNRVFIGSACAEPRYLLNELVAQGGVAGRLHDVEIVHHLSIGPAHHAAKQFDRNFRHNSFFVGEGVRQAVYDGAAALQGISQAA